MIFYPAEYHKTMFSNYQIKCFIIFQINESHLFAKMDFECRLNGAEYLAYPPVVAGEIYLMFIFLQSAVCS